MTHASLFSGIGGFDLAAEWAGWTNVFNCEIDDFCRKILKYHFPNAQQYKDITTTDFTPWRGRVDVLTGGFPCQPFSVAGKRQGTADDRYLWPEMLRVIREIQPRWIVGENVYGIINWSGGLVFEQVCVDLEDAGYDVQAYVIPACAVDAPHRRDRTWFVGHVADSPDAGTESVQEWAEQADRIDNVAHPDSNRCGQWNGEQESVSKCPRATDIGIGSTSRIVADADCDRRQTRSQERASELCAALARYKRFPTKSPICGGDDGFPARLDDITFPAWRGKSIKAYGNAVVPPLVFEIFKTINEYEKNN